MACSAEPIQRRFDRSPVPPATCPSEPSLRAGRRREISPHPDLIAVYRQRVGELSVSLDDPALWQEAAEALRGLVERIVHLPADGELRFEPVGELAGILALGKGERPRPFGQGRQTTLVAGVGFEPTTFRL